VQDSAAPRRGGADVPGRLLVLLVATLVLTAAGAAPAPAPPVRLVRNLNLVLNFPFAGNSPDLVLSLERVDGDGFSFQAASAISAADARLNKADYGGADVERSEDLKSSHHIFTRFFADEDEHAGGTVLLASSEVFEELRGKGLTTIDVVDIPGEKGMVYTPGVVYPRKNFRGTLEKVALETQRVIVDGAPVLLPVLHARGVLKARELTRQYDFWWLNDAAARLLLHYQSEDYMEFRVVRIDHPQPDDGEAGGGPVTAALSGKGSGGGAHPQLEAEGGADLGRMQRRRLSTEDDKEGEPDVKTCRATVNGVYFSTGSAELLTPSRAAIARIAAILQRHADWQVTIEGHTDNVGGDDYNLTLSRNRAAAVRQELTTRYGIDPARVKSQGYGRKRPVDSNDTAEGRSHNRRVEIARGC
jgi:outer membrane protein OmpA-like peptidoglycan-associated protein